MKWTDQSAAQNIRLFNLFSFFSSLDFTRGIFILFLLSIGLTNSHVGSMQSILFFTILALEIPSGIFADKFARKTSLLLGGLFCALSASFYLFAESYSLYIVSFVLLGVGFAFLSGANTALLYDGLAQAGEKWSQKFNGVLASNRTVISLALAVAMLVSGFLYELNPDYVFWATSGCLLLSLVFLLFIHEPKHTMEVAEKPPTLKAIKDFFKSPTGKSLIPFVLGMGFIEAIHTPFFIYSQVLFKELQFSPSQITFLLAAGYTSSALIMKFSNKLDKLPLKTAVFGISLVTALFVSTIYITPQRYIVVGLFLVINALPNLLFTLTDTYVQDHCESAVRASLTSIQSFTMAIFTSLNYLVVGMLSDGYSMSFALSVSSVLVVPALLLLYYHFYKKERSQ